MTERLPQTPSTPSPALIQATGLSLRFGASAALDGVSLSIAPGEFVSIVGPSGCGKSTLLRAIAGLATPTDGALTVAGSEPEIARRERLKVAFVFQDPTLLPWRTVDENIRLPLELSREAEDPSQKVSAARSLIGLREEDGSKRPRKLSGGMRMRVSVARALVTDPHLLLLDEPFAALDDLLRQQLGEELLRIWQEKQWTGVFVTHNVAEAVFLSQRILVMTPRPGHIANEVTVPFPYPRTLALRGEADFARLTSTTSALLRGQV